jgi:hypothetical protein
VNEVLVEYGGVGQSQRNVKEDFGAVGEALCRAIEQHEAFKQEVSDEIVKMGCWPDTVYLQRFILPKPDPLVKDFGHDLAADIHAIIEKRGGKIVWGEGE